MKIERILIIKSTVWEILSAILGFIVIYLFTQQLDASLWITLILLILKSILLALYDYYTYKLIKRLKNVQR